MAEAFAADHLRIHLHTAPPVYEPGGPVALAEETEQELSEETLTTAEGEAARRGAVLLIVPCATHQLDLQEKLEQRGFRAASAWFRGPTSVARHFITPNIRRATAADVPALLAIGENARRQLAHYSPVFWKATTSPKETFAPYVTQLVESEQNVALVYEEQGTVRGYCIVQNDYVDDFAVATPNLWASVGQELLHAGSDAAHKREVPQLILVAPDAGNDKCNAITGEGFERFRRWYVKPLGIREKDS